MPYRFARCTALIVLGFAFGGLVAGVAGAQPVNDLQAEATQLNAQIQANGAKISALGEQINGAQIKLDAAQAQMTQLEARVHGRAAVIYQTNGQGGPAVFSATNVLDLLVRSKYSSIVAGNDRRLIERLSQAKRDIAEQRASLAKAKADADAADAQQQRLLAQVTGQLGVLIAQQQQHQQQAALAVSIQRTAPTNSNWAGPPASGGAGAAVAFAEAQVGKPYASGATGPDAYDCSGLTMRAWQAGGIAMAHFSGSQFSAFPKVPMDHLQPGDLVFPSDPGAHVGIYIGGGMMIHATHTGDFVRRAPIVQDGLVMTQAVRPG